MDDSFIDDTDEALQTYLYSAYSRGNDFDFDGGHINNPKSRNIYTNNMNDTSDTGDSDVEILSSRVTRSPYSLRNNQTCPKGDPPEVRLILLTGTCTVSFSSGLN